MFLIILMGTVQFHLPLLSNMNELQKSFPSNDNFASNFVKSRTVDNSASDLVWTDTEVDRWHKKVWSYRDEIINQAHLVDMDNEEEVCSSIFDYFVCIQSGSILDSSSWKY
jgi:hypothetical protein